MNPNEQVRKEKAKVKKYVDDCIGWKSAVYPEQPVMVDYETVLHLVKTFSDQQCAERDERIKELGDEVIDLKTKILQLTISK